MAISQQAGQVPHTKWLDLKDNGVMIECAILKEDSFGNIYYIEIPNLDHIDKTRLSRMLHSRNAKNFELWDLMSQVTLNNGINALEYFHQLVKMITPSCVIMNPRQGHVGTGRVDQAEPIAPVPVAEETPSKKTVGRPAVKGKAAS